MVPMTHMHGRVFMIGVIQQTKVGVIIVLLQCVSQESPLDIYIWYSPIFLYMYSQIDHNI